MLKIQQGSVYLDGKKLPENWGLVEELKDMDNNTIPTPYSFEDLNFTPLNIYTAISAHLYYGNPNWTTDFLEKLTEENIDEYFSNMHQLPTEWSGELLNSFNSFTPEWLDFNGELCNSAIEHGHFELVKWLHANGESWKGCAAEIAAVNGHLNILKFIVDNGGYLNRWVIDRAVQNGHIEIVQYIYSLEHPECTLTEMTVRAAIYGRQLEILKWIVSTGVGLSTVMVEAALQSDCPEIIEWIITQPMKRLKLNSV